MRALSVRQPYAELILRGIKTIEYRTRATSIVGERFYIYASKGKPRIESLQTPKRLPQDQKIWSHDLRAEGNYITPLPGVWMPDSSDQLPWLLELASAMKIFPRDLPTGVIVGTAIIEKVTPGTGNTSGYFHWHLTDVRRIKTPKKPIGHPQPVWFNPRISLS